MEPSLVGSQIFADYIRIDCESIPSRHEQVHPIVWGGLSNHEVIIKFVRSNPSKDRWNGAFGSPSKILRNRQTKNAFRRLCLQVQRPTDLCATALFSFQGTNADTRPAWTALRPAWKHSQAVEADSVERWRQSHDEHHTAGDSCCQARFQTIFPCLRRCGF